MAWGPNPNTGEELEKLAGYRSEEGRDLRKLLVSTVSLGD